ncbi:MAG: caspase family protein [Phormidesmis sp. CAN_BIN44]|nr:caspase family protein [Phormidesmis sp. CAN_BIN44]
MSQTGLALVDRTRQVLAQLTCRKLALLIGINQYRSTPLHGCLTDVDLQRELLIHRFGFQPSDILTLTDRQATRSQIETAFIGHLVTPSKAGDGVVFHFSGHGSLLNLGASAEDSQTSLVTIDDSDVNSIRDRLPEDTLLLLLKSLPTDQVTTILDTGYAYPGTNLQGSLRVRSLPSPSPNQLHQAETLHSTSEPGTIRSISNALEMAQVVLQDIHQASQSTAPGTGLGETYALNVNAWTTFRFVYQVG